MLTKSKLGNSGHHKFKTKLMGQLIIDEIMIKRKYTFLDYIAGGLEMNLIIAIDCTRSNGDPRNQDSLHYFDDSKPNDYIMAMRAVGEILQHYDSDKRYPVYGFG